MEDGIYKESIRNDDNNNDKKKIFNNGTAYE